MAKNVHSYHSRGFTLLEVLISIVISGILIIGLTRYYRTALKSHSLQEQITDMNQNAQYVLTELSDVLMQAGAACVATANSTTDMDTIIKLTGAGPVHNEFTIKVNPRGGLHIITNSVTLNTTANCSLEVSDASQFRYADKLARIPRAGSTDSTIKTYNLVGINTASNKICLNGGASTSEAFNVNDAVYGFVNNRYYLNGTDLCLNSDNNVLAENIDTLLVTFYDADGDSLLTSSPPWRSMRSANVQVVATTPDPFPGDPRRRTKLSYQFRLRNKVGGKT